MQDPISTLKREFAHDLALCGRYYLEIGLEKFYLSGDWEPVLAQVALGNLTIAVELMLKAVIADSSLLAVFQNPSQEMILLLSCPEMCTDSPNWRSFQMRLRSGNYKMLEFDQCLAVAYLLAPELKRSLSSHLRHLSRHRNQSVHSLFPRFQKYDIERAVFAALNVAALIERIDESLLLTHARGEKDTAFLKKFEEARNERVEKAVAEAKKRCATLESSGSSVSVDSWDFFVVECPICESDGVLEGSTELNVMEGGYAAEDHCLTFFADRFQCDECGLALEDSDEVRLAGIEVGHDRDTELERWFREKMD